MSEEAPHIDKTTKKLSGFSPQANYTDRAIAQVSEANANLSG
jgi:hypothetical protein